METTIIMLLLAGVATLFVLDVVLGRPGFGGRLQVREFSTRLIPLFLGGLGLALWPGHPVLGGGLLVLALILFLAGNCCRHQVK